MIFTSVSGTLASATTQRNRVSKKMSTIAMAASVTHMVNRPTLVMVIVPRLERGLIVRGLDTAEMS